MNYWYINNHQRDAKPRNYKPSQTILRERKATTETAKTISGSLLLTEWEGRGGGTPPITEVKVPRFRCNIKLSRATPTMKDPFVVHHSRTAVDAVIWNCALARDLLPLEVLHVQLPNL